MPPPSSAPSRSDAVRLNRVAYEAKYRHDLEQTDTGRIALMHDEKLVDIYDDANIACEQGLERYGSGNYSIVWIGAKPLSLGIFTFAPRHRRGIVTWRLWQSCEAFGLGRSGARRSTSLTATVREEQRWWTSQPGR